MHGVLPPERPGGKRVKIRIALTVELSPSDWAEEFGTGNNEEEVREDVRTHVLELVHSSTVFTDLGAQVTRGL